MPDNSTPGPNEPIPVAVSVADDQLARLPEVVAALRAAGLSVDDVLEPIGTVTGSVPGSTLAALAAVPGVLGVQRQRSHRLPPEDRPQ